MTQSNHPAQEFSGQVIGPLEYKTVSNVEAYIAHAVSYKGSQPFCGFFAAWDVDECIRYEADGRKFIAVECQWEDEESEEYLELELLDTFIQSIVGHDGEVVSRIGRIVQE